jgi:GNAT superfamily N-acetyltransferase
MSEATIAAYVPGAIGRVVELHAMYYSENWQFGAFFEAKIAAGLSEFLHRFDAERDGFWTVSLDGRVEGSLAIDGIKADTEGAHLRWFILSEAVRGRGMGNRFMQEAVAFCKRKGYARIYLSTFAGLDPARHLYEKFGFQLAEERSGSQWGREVTEQRFVLELGQNF